MSKPERRLLAPTTRLSDTVAGITRVLELPLDSPLRSRELCRNVCGDRSEYRDNYYNKSMVLCVVFDAWSGCQPPDSQRGVYQIGDE